GGPKHRSGAGSDDGRAAVRLCLRAAVGPGGGAWAAGGIGGGAADEGRGVGAARAVRDVRVRPAAAAVDLPAADGDGRVPGVRGGDVGWGDGRARRFGAGPRVLRGEGCGVSGMWVQLAGLGRGRVPGVWG